MQVQNNTHLLNQRAQLAQDYHTRVKNDHKQQLFEQMSMDKRNKAAYEQALRQADASQAQ